MHSSEEDVIPEDHYYCTNTVITLEHVGNQHPELGNTG